MIAADAKRYIEEIHSKKEDPSLAETLYKELLEPGRQYGVKPDLIVVPDGALHLLPFAALAHD
jgi:hypothetical protein